MKFIRFHGSFGGPDENWSPYLKENLTKLGHEFLTPKFPVDDWDQLLPEVQNENQNLDNWLKAFDEFYESNIKPDDQLCFIGHSLGCLFILHVVEKYNIQLDSAIFAAPFLTKLFCDWQIDLVNETFYKDNFDWDKLQKLIPVSYSLYSDNDKYVKESYPTEFAKNLNSNTILVKGKGHLNSKAGLDNFPLLLELCKTRIP